MVLPVVVTDGKNRLPPAASLLALTCAAAALPGMVPGVSAQSTESNQRFQAAHYREGGRDLIDTGSGMKPLSVDVAAAMGSINIASRWRVDYRLAQDVWSGATPVATAPLAFRGNRPVLRNTGSGVVESGASPFVNGNLMLDENLVPLYAGGQGASADSRSVLIMSSASPETRRQADISLSHEWDEAMLSWSAGTSREPDYRSQSAGLDGRLDFNGKTSALSAGIGYNRSRISAVLDSDLQPYLTKTAYDNRILRQQADDVLRDRRQDWSATIGWSQVLNRSAIMELSAGVIDSRGFLANPYKVTLAGFYDPAERRPGAGVTADMRALMEQRPEKRRQTLLSGKYRQHIARFDAALHAGYQYSRDDWGVRSHTLELEWVQPLGALWTITPMLRYYSQRQADFYVDYLLSDQRYRDVMRDETGREIWEGVNRPDQIYIRNPDGRFTDSNGARVDLSDLSLRPRYRYFDFAQLPAHFSSDHRLAGFGSISAGFNLTRSLGRDTTLELGVEYYRRDAGLRLGEGTNTSFADHHGLMTAATLTINPQRPAQQQRLDRLRDADDVHAHHHGGHGTTQHRHSAPAGLMFAHAMESRGDRMLAYGFEHLRSSSHLYHGSSRATDAEVVARACAADNACRLAPDDMVMNMHMLDVGYALSDHLSLMLMLHFMDMNMTLRDLQGRPPLQTGSHEHRNLRGHTTGGVGDILAGGVYRLAAGAGGEWLAGFGVSIPTGSVNEKMRRMFREDGSPMHFDMQTGSGTWDVVPSLSYSRSYQAGSWGAQLAGTYRLENRNSAGYRLGNVLRFNTWGDYAVNGWLSITGRLSWMTQQAISGDFRHFTDRHGPMDYPHNSGGRFLDAGLGMRLNIPAGDYAGHSLLMEWLEPVHQHLNGYQLGRTGTIRAAWQIMF